MGISVPAGFAYPVLNCSIISLSSVFLTQRTAVLPKDRRVLISAFLIVSATYATLYTVAAHDLARWGWTCRGTLGDATFLPFPTGPRGVLMDVMAKMSPSDEFIYAHLIRTGALVGISILLWILAAIYLLKVVLPVFWKSSSLTPVNLLRFCAPGTRTPS